jgi:hypothetical protein
MLLPQTERSCSASTSWDVAGNVSGRVLGAAATYGKVSRDVGRGVLW